MVITDCAPLWPIEAGTTARDGQATAGVALGLGWCRRLRIFTCDRPGPQPHRAPARADWSARPSRQFRAARHSESVMPFLRAAAAWVWMQCSRPCWPVIGRKLDDGYCYPHVGVLAISRLARALAAGPCWNITGKCELTQLCHNSHDGTDHEKCAERLHPTAGIVGGNGCGRRPCAVAALAQ